MDRTSRIVRTGVAFGLGACTLPVFRFVTEAFGNGDSTVTNEEELVGLLGPLLIGCVAGSLQFFLLAWRNFKQALIPDRITEQTQGGRP